MTAAHWHACPSCGGAVASTKISLYCARLQLATSRYASACMPASVREDVPRQLCQLQPPLAHHACLPAALAAHSGLSALLQKFIDALIASKKGNFHMLGAPIVSKTRSSTKMAALQLLGPLLSQMHNSQDLMQDGFCCRHLPWLGIHVHAKHRDGDDTLEKWQFL